MSNDKVQFNPLLAGANPDDIMPEYNERTPEMEAVDRMFLDRAKKALAEAGCTALDHLAAHPEVSKIELAKRLNRGANAIGLTMAIYEDAESRGLVRDAAKDLLLRKIHEEFPSGWKSGGSIHPHVRMGFWDMDVQRYCKDAKFGKCAKQILRHLTIDHPPPEGWTPKPQNDPLIDELFDRYWPVEPEEAP